MFFLVICALFFLVFVWPHAAICLPTDLPTLVFGPGLTKRALGRVEHTMSPFSGIAHCASVRWGFANQNGGRLRSGKTTDQTTYCLDPRLKWCEVAFRNKYFLCTEAFFVQAKTSLVLRTTSSTSFEKTPLSPRRMGYASSTC